MTSDQGDPSADVPSNRSELERTAFARPRTDAEAAAAADALRQLVAADLRAAAIVEPPAEPVVRDEPEAAESALPATTPVGEDASNAADVADAAFAADVADRTKPSRQRSVIPLLIAVGLVLGLGGGFLLARSTAASSVNVQVLKPTPSATGALQKSDALAALAALGAPQSSKHPFPLPGVATTLNLDPASIHFVMTTDDGPTLWIARASQDICLIFTGGDSRSPANAGSSCATPEAFNRTGLAINDGHDEWSWDGKVFTLETNVTQ